VLITLSYDSSVGSAPAGFTTAIQTVASMLDSIIENPIDVTLDIGYGEEDGDGITGSTIAEAGPIGIDLTYSQLVGDLRAASTSATDFSFLSSLPAADPNNGGPYFLSMAQAKALGLQTASSNETDGFAGFSSSVTWDVDPSNGITAGSTDLVGAALHELTHALGRIMPDNLVTSMDLLAYGSNSQIDVKNGDPRYLSFNGGKTGVANFDTGSDPADFAAGSSVDPFDAYLSQGTVYSWTATDSQIMDALGYNVGAAAPTTSSLAVLDTATDQNLPGTFEPYVGPVSGVTNEYITTTTDSLNITVTSPNWFIHSGSGNDAIAVNSGTNVLDGSTGSNFLTGGSGNDTFFIDDRGSTSSIWSTVNNFHSGDSVTIWGVTPSDFNLSWLDGQGAVGYTGLTLNATSPGKSNASVTMVGFSSADLTNGRLAITYGSTAADNGVPGSSFMYVHAI
jgi:hypothetical protein